MSRFEFFSDEELKCRCGNCGMGADDMDVEFMAEVIELRREIGVPFIVTSAIRCPEHNNQVSSTGLNGPHTTGKALDIRANSRLRSLIMQKAYEKGFNRFGVARTFLHIDGLTFAEGFDEDVVWTYS